MASESQAFAARLRQAREQANLTQEQVAEWLRVRRPAIAEIESGKRAVKSTELMKLAELYGKSLKWLVEGSESAEERVAAALFRAGEAETPGLRREVAKLARRCRLIGDLEERLDLTRTHDRLPRYRNDQALHDWSLAMSHGTEVAYQERARLGIGTAAAVNDAWGVLEDAGLHVFGLKLGDREIDGIYTQLGDGRACVGVNVDKWYFRQVFTVVHEYAHAVMDGDAMAQACVTGRGWDVTRDRSVYHNRELRANQFAAVFLVPKEALFRYLDARNRRAHGHGATMTPMDIVRAQDHFGVSAEMLLWRLKNERVIDASQRKELGDHLKRVGVHALARQLGYDWPSRAQPFPRVQELALKAYAKGLVSLGIVAELFDRSKEDMSDLLGTWGVTQEFSADDALVGQAG